MPIYIPPIVTPLSDVIQWAIVDSLGEVHDLTWQTDRTVFVPKGTTGLGIPPVELVLEKLPFSRGSILRYIRTQPIEINLPIVINKSSLIHAMIAAQTIRGWFYTGNERARRPAYLRITRPQDNVQRQIAVYYKDGLEGDMEVGSPTFIPYVIGLLAPDPTWTDIENTEIDYDQAEIGNNQVINNPGDFDAYPIFTINGPAQDIIIANRTISKQIALTHNGGIAISAGQSIIVDTRPVIERNTLPVLDGEGTNLYDKVSPSSSLETWLQPGNNQIRFFVNGTSAATSIHVEYLPRYLGVLR